MKIAQILAAPMLFALAACGGLGSGDDFTVQTKGSVADAFMVLSAARAGDASTIFPGIHFTMTRPSDKELVYTIPMKEHPGDKGKVATIRFRLDPGADGRATQIRVRADVPRIRMLMGKANMYLSEVKVESELRKVMTDIARNISAGSTSAGNARALSDLLVAVAVAGNFDMQAMANQYKRDPGMLSDRFDDSAADNDMALEDRPRDFESEPEAAEPDPEPEFVDASQDEIPVE